jgi:hypothetical protein
VYFADGNSWSTCCTAAGPDPCAASGVSEDSDALRRQIGFPSELGPRSNCPSRGRATRCSGLAGPPRVRRRAAPLVAVGQRTHNG